MPLDLQAGIEHPCPRCHAQPGEPCWDQRHGRARRTTHQERKDLTRGS